MLHKQQLSRCMQHLLVWHPVCGAEVCAGPQFAASSSQGSSCEVIGHMAAEGDTYILIDLPRQVELFTLHSSLKEVVQVLTDKWRYRCVLPAHC